MKPLAPTPFVKWAGGKRTVVGELRSRGLLPEDLTGTYHEPFLGGGAVFLSFLPQRALLGDSNAELINAYRAVKTRPAELVELLRAHEERHNSVSDDEREKYFYSVRSNVPTKSVERAARFVYLNRTCYNGLYRVNQRGEFNVPIGRYSRPTICDERNIWAVHGALKAAQLRCQDFRKFAPRVKEGDLVYCDPPYDPLSSTSNFTSYTPNDFTDEDQKDLARLAIEWSELGAKVVVSNSATPFIRRLYTSKGFTLSTIHVPRAINSRATARGRIPELLIYNFAG